LVFWADGMTVRDGAPHGGRAKSFAFSERPGLWPGRKSGLLDIVKRGCIRWFSGASGFVSSPLRILRGFGWRGCDRMGSKTVGFAMGAGLTAGVCRMRSKENGLFGSMARRSRCGDVPVLRRFWPVLQKGQAGRGPLPRGIGHR
jgi:hypothetical protein